MTIFCWPDGEKIIMRRRIHLFPLLSILLYISSTNVYAGYYSSRYSNQYTEYSSLAIKNCKYSVVTVTYISILCNSPYTFYYVSRCAFHNATRRSPLVKDFSSLFSHVVTRVMEPIGTLQFVTTEIKLHYQ